MDIYAELEQTEQRANELRVKVAQLGELEKKKQELEESENLHKLACKKAEEKLHQLEQETIESLNARKVLMTRIERLQAEQAEYNRRVNQEIGELSAEATVIVNRAGEQLFHSFTNWWELTNPKVTSGTNQSSAFGNYNVDAMANAFQRDRKLQSDWKRQWNKLITQVYHAN